MITLFWLSVALIVYTYVLYPILLTIIVKLVGNKRQTKPFQEKDNWPEVAVVIAAYNEEKVIKARIENLLGLDYPADKITYLVGSDGSQDNTNTILSSFDDPRLQAHLFEINRGKASVLNNLMEMVTQPIVVFSDANTDFEPDAIKRLVAHFDDQAVGAVCGELNLFNPGNNDNKDGVYWRFEQFLKKQESKIDALLGANGAIYAIRSTLYQAIPSNTIVDDFLIVMNVAKLKHRIIYDTQALAHEEIAPNIAEESKRRIRIGTGNYQAFMRLLWALNPATGWRSFSYISHKVLRWFTPHFMVIALITNALLIGEPLYFLGFLLQIAVYAAAHLGMKKTQQGQQLPSILAFITFFVAMNFSLLQGFYRFAFKNVQGTWQRTSR